MMMMVVMMLMMMYDDGSEDLFQASGDQDGITAQC